jgi:hypothetical protein
MSTSGDQQSNTNTNSENLQFQRQTLTSQISNDVLEIVGQSSRLTFPAPSDASAVSSSNGYLSDVEVAILRSAVPIQLNETEEITVLGQRGLWANRDEVVNWRGPLPINEYTINEDANPEVITKRTQQRLEYIQELAIRYLRPPTPPVPGEIVITQETNNFIQPAPPLIIRQQPPRPATPEPLVIREAPPQPPNEVGRRVITISGKRLPPPPRKVVIERLAPLPSKPQSVIIERWLPYAQTKRRVIFKKSDQNDPVVVKPKNVIIQWEAPYVTIKKEFKYLGIIRANPVDYAQRYTGTLKTARELPEFVLDIKPPAGVVLAAEASQSYAHELEGDVSALKLVDLDKEGLAEYKIQLQRLGLAPESPQTYSNASSQNTPYYASVASAIGDIFLQVDKEGNGSISVDEAEKLFLKLNTRLGRRYGEDDIKAFFNVLDVNKDGSVNLQEFRAAFERLQ